MKTKNSENKRIKTEKSSTFYFLFSIFCTILLSAFYFLLPTASAAGLAVACGGKNESPCTLCDLFKLGKNLINFSMEIISVLAIAFIIYGGIMMMLGSGNPQKIKESQGIIWSAIIGIIIISCSWVILNTFFHLMTGGLAWPWDDIQCKI